MHDKNQQNRNDDTEQSKSTSSTHLSPNSI